MSSPRVSHTIESSSDLNIEKSGLAVAESTAVPQSEKEHLHFVPRKDVLIDYDTSQESIVGFNAELMGARSTLSTSEEKKLLRRIDLHLIPLLAVMYMVKSIDASNVRYPRVVLCGG